MTARPARQRHVAFLPYPEHGHFYPTFKLARDLVDRGHHVTFVGLADHRRLVADQGFCFETVFAASCPEGFLAARATAQGRENIAAVIASLDQRPRGNTGSGDELRNRLDALRPDIVVVDVLLPGLALAARDAGLRVSLLNIVLANPWVDSTDAELSSLKALPELILCPRKFDFEQATTHPQRIYVEAGIHLQRSRPTFAWEAIDETRPLIYCSLGTQAHLYPGALDVLRGAIEMAAVDPEIQLVAHVGKSIDRSELPRSSGNVLLAEHTPQLALLARAAAAITHGGLGTLKECVYFGVPTVVFAMDRDQPMNAARITHHGLGVTGELGALSARGLREQLDFVRTDPALKASLLNFQTHFREQERKAPGARFIEVLAR